MGVNLLVSDYSELVKLIKKAAVEAVEAGSPAALTFGTVVSTNPLKVKIDQKMTLGKVQLMIPQHLTDYSVDVDVNWTTESQSISASTTINEVILKDKDDKEQFRFTPHASTNLNPSSHSHTINGKKRITFHNSLKTGDSVALMREQGGQRYFIIDKVVS